MCCKKESYLAIDKIIHAVIKTRKIPINESTSSGKTLTDNEIRDNTKAIRSLENSWMFLKGTTGKITSKEREFTINGKCAHTIS